MWARGRALCKQRGSSEGGRDSSVSQGLDSQDFSTSKSGVTWCGHWQCLLSPTVCSSRHHIPAHSTATLLTLGKFTDVPSYGIRVCRIRIPLDIRSDSQCLMSWCACRVSELVGDGQGELDLISERKCLNLASWVEWRYLIQQVYTKCLYSCHCTAHCTLPSVCHSDQLENITAATNKYCDTRRQSLSDIPIIRVLPPPPAERGRSPSGPRLSVSDEAKWSLLKWPERTHYYNIKFLSSDIISH